MTAIRSVRSAAISWLDSQRTSKIILRAILFHLLCTSSLVGAMTPDQFIQFLTNTPPYGYAKVVKITHIHSTNRDVTNRLYKTYEHSWGDGNFISKVTEGSSQRGIGTFNKMEWNESDDIITKYLGVNDIDSTRHNTPERVEFDSLVSLGIRYLDHSSVRKEGSELYAEVYQPESLDSAGIKRRLRGAI